jgi:dihydrodipicolinate synthase/N-acetylneuraminate lyase
MKGRSMALTPNELRYLEACMEVADGDGEHAAEFGVDCGAMQVKLQEEISFAKAAEELEMQALVMKKDDV